MTVSEDGRVGRPPRFSPEERAALGDEAWSLKDTQGMSTRKIRDLFRSRGVDMSHTTVWQLISEAQERAQFLDYVGPAQSRAASIGRLDRMIERVMAQIDRYEAAIETGELDLDKGGPMLDKAHARYASYEQTWIRLTGAAMPTRHSLEDPNGNPVTPNMPLFAGLRHAVNEHEQKTRDMEENDGLDG